MVANDSSRIIASMPAFKFGPKALLALKFEDFKIFSSTMLKIWLCKIKTNRKKADFLAFQPHKSHMQFEEKWKLASPSRPILLKLYPAFGAVFLCASTEDFAELSTEFRHARWRWPFKDVVLKDDANFWAWVFKVLSPSGRHLRPSPAVLASEADN